MNFSGAASAAGRSPPGKDLRMKAIVSLLLILSLLCACAPGVGEGGGVEAAAEPAAGADRLVVGNPTPMKGDFFTDMWGNATSDLDVRTVIHGYNLIMWDGAEGLFKTDPTVVNGVAVVDDAQGNRTYYMNLYTDLFFSDGTPITAADYAFTLLFSIDPVVEQLGGKPLRNAHILGYDAYIQGTSPVLSGVRIINEKRLAITIRREYLPFFYEMGLLSCVPYPRHIIAPDSEIKDDGQGAYVEGGFDLEKLKAAVLDPETGYLSHPSVSSGPYVLASFDGVTAEFDINPYFKGDTDGLKPVIPHVTFTAAGNEDMIDKLSQGEFGLLNKVTRADVIQAGTQLTAEGLFGMTNYPRTGLTFISFNCERPAIQSQAVRQAVAMCMDKDALVTAYVGNYGIRADGYYGLGQWMYQMLNGTLAHPEREGQDSEESWSALTLDDVRRYALDPAGAAALLEQDGWTLDAQGQPYAGEGVRCKEIDGALVPLEMTLAYPAGNAMADGMLQHMAPYLAQAGMGLTLLPTEMTDLLDMFYRRAERDTDMLYLGTDFDVVFDPSAHFTAGEDGNLSWNYTALEDEELYRLAVEMRQTKPGDILAYCTRWLAFQQRFMEILPMIPVYSNVYFDFYSLALQEYNVSEAVTWSQAVVKAYLGDAQEAADIAAMEELDDDEIFIDD